MKKLSKYIIEKGEQLDDQWLNDEKPVKTEDGRQAIITHIDRSQVPNIIHGQVKMIDSLFDFTWEETGKCLTCVDQYGNSKQPSKADNLIKQI